MKEILLLREVKLDDLIRCVNIRTERNFTGTVTKIESDGIYVSNIHDNYFAHKDLFDYERGVLK